MSLLIQNGRIVTASDDFVGDVLVEGEIIAAVGPKLAAPAGADGIRCAPTAVAADPGRCPRGRRTAR